MDRLVPLLSSHASTHRAPPCSVTVSGLSGRRSKQQQTPSSIKHPFSHEHQSLKTSSSTLLSPVTEPALQQQQVTYWDDELHLVFVGVTWHIHTQKGWKHEAGRRFHYRKVYIFNELHSFVKQLLTLTWHKPNQTPLQLVKVSNVVNQAVHGRHTCSCKPHWGGFARHVSLWCWWLVACIHSPLWLANVA